MTGSQLVRLVFHEVDASPDFGGWLTEQGISLTVTNGNRLFLIGGRPDGSLEVIERDYLGAGAVAADGPDALFLATRYQIWRLQDALPPGQVTEDGHDRLFVPQSAWTTGRVEAHGLAPDGQGGVVFVNGRFSCLATLDERLNFRPVWMPPFVSALTPEDRCHLTGVALRDGRPAYVTCAAATDTPAGWREHRRNGGVVLAVAGGDVVAAGLSLPHSPVLVGDRLWLANGGAGELGFVDTRDGSYQAVASLPGFTRGLAVLGGFAVVAVSKPPRGQTFAGLDLADRVPPTGPECGIFVVSLATGRVEHRLLLNGGAPENNDLDILAGAVRPTAVAFQGDDVQEWVTMPD